MFSNRTIVAVAVCCLACCIFSSFRHVSISGPSQLYETERANTPAAESQELGIVNSRGGDRGAFFQFFPVSESNADDLETSRPIQARRGGVWHSDNIHIEEDPGSDSESSDAVTPHSGHPTTSSAVGDYRFFPVAHRLGPWTRSSASGPTRQIRRSPDDGREDLDPDPDDGGDDDNGRSSDGAIGPPADGAGDGSEDPAVAALLRAAHISPHPHVLPIPAGRGRWWPGAGAGGNLPSPSPPPRFLTPCLSPPSNRRLSQLRARTCVACVRARVCARACARA